MSNWDEIFSLQDLLEKKAAEFQAIKNCYEILTGKNADIEIKQFRENQKKEGKKTESRHAILDPNPNGESLDLELFQKVTQDNSITPPINEFGSLN